MEVYVFSRRVLLIAGARACFGSDAAKSPAYPSEAKRYNDPLTEFPVVRLTSPEYTSRLTAYYNRGMAGKSTLFFCCDRERRMAVFRVDLRSGETRRIAEGERIEPSTLDLLPGDRALLYADGRSLRLLSINNLKSRELYAADGDIIAASASEDGTHATVIEKSGGLNRLTLIPIGTGSPRRLAEAEEPLDQPVHRSMRAAILYRRGAESLYLANYDGQKNYRLRLSADAVGTPQWSPDGRSILYLSIPATPERKNEIREFTPDTNEDKPVAPTSRFVQFRANADASVFVGASGSKASPQVLLLLRSVKRELTVCEHRASDPGMVSPVFSPNSQRILFVSDQHGKPAIYTINTERLVEET
jgi:Tol biopolymer transport system component